MESFRDGAAWGRATVKLKGSLNGVTDGCNHKMK